VHIASSGASTAALGQPPPDRHLNCQQCARAYPNAGVSVAFADRPFETMLAELKRLKEEYPDRILIASIMEEYNK
jgi:hypothetical protein